ncbi:MAG: hypothetical protein AVDCRST_MAG86-3791 [uncultured Truepera sp.]|uniref:Uncharacterized protein n=1 Tax=uncultured Truepera sp. TaxID=543023 RepID=A0A6J4VQA7_9DEIN|nr:MAG: hypothetical protein AVDCRST_MAG86-3791 [uncultured Truepera sp.]
MLRDAQFLRGHCLLLADPAVADLNELGGSTAPVGSQI